MALYKYSNFVVPSPDGAFDQIHHPGANTPYTGIYRCEGCGFEIAAYGGYPLPPPNHHCHEPVHGAIRWRMVTYAQSRPAI